jgi:Lrp/AsnC family leucine-responsive transcriptional regulator
MEDTARHTLDKIDAKILRVLQQDGRISNLKLAEDVHLSPTAVLERVKRLSRDGYILGYEARLNPDKLGAGMMVFIGVLFLEMFFRWAASWCS